MLTTNYNAQCFSLPDTRVLVALRCQTQAMYVIIVTRSPHCHKLCNVLSYPEVLTIRHINTYITIKKVSSLPDGRVYVAIPRIPHCQAQ